MQSDFSIWSNHHFLLEKLLWTQVIQKAQNPQNIPEHIMWISLWILNSTIIIWELLFSFGIWIIKAPTDLLALATKKAEIDSFRRI